MADSRIPEFRVTIRKTEVITIYEKTARKALEIAGKIDGMTISNVIGAIDVRGIALGADISGVCKCGALILEYSDGTFDASAPVCGVMACAHCAAKVKA